MATSEDFKRSFLTCDICFEVYTSPKCLPCLHTFCQKCLSSYIQAEDDTFGVKRKSGFPCPICREFTRPKDPYKPLSGWARDFKTHFYIENLMSAMKVKDADSHAQTTRYENILSTVATPELPQSSGLSNTTWPQDVVSSNRTENYSTEHFTTDTQQSSVDSRDSVTITTLPSADSGGKIYQLLKKLTCFMPGDKSSSPKPCNVCVVSDVIVLLDFENSAVKTLSNWRVKLEENVVTSRLVLKDKPKSVTRLSDSVVAVTAPEHCSVHMLSIFPKLEIITTVKTPRKYKSIAATGERSLLGLTLRPTPGYYHYHPSSQIDILNYDGLVLKSLSLSKDVCGLDFTHMTISSAGFIHLVDSTRNALSCLTQDGIELYRYQPMDDQEMFKSLNGLCCLSDNVYLTDFESNSIYEVKCDSVLPVACDKLLTASNDIMKPTDVHVEPDGSVYVACWDGYIRVYTIKSILKKPKQPKRRLETSI